MFVNSHDGNKSGGKANEAEEGFGKFVVTGGYAPEVFDALKEVFHQMPFAITALAIRAVMFAVRARRDTRLDATLQQAFTEGIAIITFVGHEHGRGEFCDEGFCMGDIRLIGRAQEQPNWPPRLIDDGMDFCVQAALGAPHGLGMLTPTRIAGTAMHFDVRGIQEAAGTFQRCLDLAEELGPDALASPPEVILIDAVPGCSRSMNRPPLATLS